jgi:hypothetical protein
VATPLVDSPSAPPNGQAPPPARPPDGPDATSRQQPAATPQSAPVAPAERNCKRCGGALASGQDWCLQCGAGAPGSLGAPSWRSGATILLVVAVLVLGAAAAAFAALSKGSSKPRVVIKTVAQAPAPTATTPAGTTPGGLGGLGAGTNTRTTPLGTVKPPKIPLTAVTPKASEKTTATTTPPAETKTTASKNPTSTTPSEKTGEESQQAAIILDTDAASTYNPYNYPASGFGDPSLAIDGETSTAWTAQVNAATAPRMAEGLLIDIKAKERVAVLELITATPGMTVQVYGANGHTAPSTITSPAWTPLSPPEVIKKKHTRIALRHSAKAFTFVTLWISKAPESSTPQAPGHVDVNELELFPPS